MEEIMNQPAWRLEEHPWGCRTLPPRPTRLVPPACPARSRTPWHLSFRGELDGPLAEILQMAGQSIGFLFLLGSVLSGFWALSLL
jgi:hypothetical protein